MVRSDWWIFSIRIVNKYVDYDDIIHICGEKHRKRKNRCKVGICMNRAGTFPRRQIAVVFWALHSPILFQVSYWYNVHCFIIEASVPKLGCSSHISTVVLPVCMLSRCLLFKGLISLYFRVYRFCIFTIQILIFPVSVYYIISMCASVQLRQGMCVWSGMSFW